MENNEKTVNQDLTLDDLDEISSSDFIGGNGYGSYGGNSGF